MIILEKNRRIPEILPDVYIFIDRPVADPRRDADHLKTQAHIVVNDSIPDGDLIAYIQDVLSRRCE